MRKGKTIQELATEVKRQAETKKDFVRPTQLITLGDDTKLRFPVAANGDAAYDFPLNSLAHRQLGEHAGIPALYYDKMLREAPDLLAKNVNRWLGSHVVPTLDNANPEARMIRTLDGRVRAILSDRYRPLENVDLAEAVLPVLADLGVMVLSSEITERRLYIKATDESVTKDVPTGKAMGDGGHIIFDTLMPAIVISNSEVGSGALSVRVGVYTKVCTNLAFFGERSMKQYHVGGKKQEMFGDDMSELLSSEAKAADDKATWLKVRDVVKAAFERARFEASVERIAAMTEQRIPAVAAAKFVDIIGKRLGTTETERTSILGHLIEGGDLTRYGLFNAVTRTAEDIVDYDRASEFERLGGNIIDLAANDWKAVEKEAA